MVRVRLLCYITAAAALICAAFPGISQAACSSPCQAFTSGSGLSYPTNPQNNNVAWVTISVPTSASAPGFPANTTISHITVTLNTWTENADSGGFGSGLDREFVLQAPSGQTFEFIGEVTTDTPFTRTYTLDDSASSKIPDNGFSGPIPASGSYQPNVVVPSGNALNQECENFPTQANAKFDPNTGVPTYDAATNQNCAQQTTHGTLGSVFNGVVANGTWVVWMFDPLADDNTASVASVEIDITPAVAASTTTTVSSNATNNEVFAGASITFTATVKSGGTNVSEGTVTFENGNTTISGCGSVAVSGGTATCSTSLSGEGNHVITATYNGDSTFNTSSGTVAVFVDNQTSQNGSTFCNNGTITLNEVGSAQPGSPYPQHIFVSDLTGSVTGVTLTLQNVNAYLGSFELLLVGPDGKAFVPLSKAGSTVSHFVGTLVLSDAAGSLVPQNSTPAPGTYLPTDYNSAISFPAPAPAGPYKAPATVGSDTFATAFTGEPANDPNNDKWSLYAYSEQFQGDSDSIGGYCLTFTTNNLPSTTTTVQSNPNMQTTTGTSVTFTATVKSGVNPVNGQGTVKFEEGGTVLSGPTAINSSGQATFTTSSLTEGIHTIEAIYSGAAGAFNGSSGTVTIEIDTPTTNTTAGQYCNPGGLAINSPSSANGETATPYPSRVNVTNEAGTVNTVSVAVNGVTLGDPQITLFMLEGPSGSNIVFWDDAGGGNPITSPINLTFSDSASGQLGASTTPTNNGSYQPTANNQLVNFAFPSTAIANQPPSPSYAAPLGSTTFTSAFGNINPNNYWSLFWFNRPSQENSTVASWCLNITNNPPVVTLAKVHNGTFTQGDTSDTYTITVANPSGPGSTAGTMTLTDTLPAGITATGLSETGHTGGGTGSDWTCTVGTVSCTRTTPMAPGESDTITLTVNVSYNAVTTTNGSVNNVSLSGGGISGSPVTAHDTQTVQVGPGYALNLSVNPSGAGTATANPTNSAGLTAGHYVPGATVTLTATPTAGYGFSSWSGSADLSSTTNNPTTITMNSATESVTANFVVAYTNVTGSISVSSNGFFYNRTTHRGTATYTLKNTSGNTILGPVELVLSGMGAGVTGANNTGTFMGNPYWTVTGGSLAPGASATVSVSLSYALGTNFTTTAAVYSGNLQ